MCECAFQLQNLLNEPESIRKSLLQKAEEDILCRDNSLWSYYRNNTALREVLLSVVNCFQLLAASIPAGLGPAGLLLHWLPLSRRTEHFPVDVEAFNHLSEHFLGSSS